MHATGVSERSTREQKRWRRLCGAAALLGTFPLAWWLRPVLVEDTMPVCIYRSTLGKPCPFCGLTRAFAQITHGRFDLAWKYNPLWPVAVAAVIVFATLLTVDAFSRSDHAAHFGRTLTRRWYYIAGALAVFGVYRALA